MSARIEYLYLNGSAMLKLILPISMAKTRGSRYCCAANLWRPTSRARGLFQGGIISTDDDETLNIGVGQRWILKDGKIIAGLNLFYDNEWDAGHERMSVGGEVLAQSVISG